MAAAAGTSQLVSAGVGLAKAILTKPDTSAVYTREYQKTIQKENGIRQQYAAQLSVASARARGVKQRTMIGLNQAQAEALLRGNAAAAGVRGGSVQDTIYQTEANAAYRTSDQLLQEQNTIESALNEVYSGNQQLNIPDDNYNVSLLGAAAQGVGDVLDNGFLTDLGLAMEKMPTANDEYRVEQRKVDVTDIQSEPGGRGGV